MATLTKNTKAAKSKLVHGKEYDLAEAARLLKEITFTKFDASVDIDIRLGIDPKKADQMVRGVVALPHGTGKQLKVCVICTPDKEKEAKDAGADYVGLDDMVKKIEEGWTDMDIIITMPTVMAKVGKLGRILGPRGLMPNPKSGTVTLEIGKTVKEVKQGKMDFKVDKAGIIHTRIAKVSFTPEQIKENAEEIIHSVARLKPSSAKGTYFRSITLSSTMSPGISIDKNSISGL